MYGGFRGPGIGSPDAESLSDSITSDLGCFFILSGAIPALPDPRLEYLKEFFVLNRIVTYCRGVRGVSGALKWAPLILRGGGHCSVFGRAGPDPIKSFPLTFFSMIILCFVR